MNFSDLYFSFNGRIGRQTYWMKGMVVLGILGALAFGLDMLVEADGVIFSIIYLLAIWPSLALQAKRWHDLNRSAWWILMSLVPLVNIWAAIELGFIKGTEGENEYGSDPMGESRSGPITRLPVNAMQSSVLKPTTLREDHQSKQMLKRLTESKKLFEEGLLTQEEYSAVRNKIISTA